MGAHVMHHWSLYEHNGYPINHSHTEMILCVVGRINSIFVINVPMS